MTQKYYSLCSTVGLNATFQFQEYRSIQIISTPLPRKPNGLEGIF